ncbi:hypothetical protein [Streptomyces sioyaensis]|uniref:hypothetical protein n=1 Tax=Streptomyces sioyaensis TaxID=67364 RepID=UPI001FD16432|nr:hypothetical protein [Streptomyces sioyaensis]
MGKVSSLYAGVNTPRRRAAVMAGVLASVSVIALGTASAASQGAEKSTTAAVQPAPATDSAREHWQPPTHPKVGPGDAGAEFPILNADYLISEVSPAQHRGWWYQSHLTGINVTWMTPSGRDPYDGWDWIEIIDSKGNRVTWDWACGNDHCGAYGSTMISLRLNKGEEYRALYWSDGGRVTKGNLRAEFEFWA